MGVRESFLLVYYLTGLKGYIPPQTIIIELENAFWCMWLAHQNKMSFQCFVPCKVRRATALGVKTIIVVTASSIASRSSVILDLD